MSRRRECPSSPLNPKNGVAIFGFEREPELYLNLLRAPDEVEYLFRLLGQGVQFACQPRQRLIQRDELVAVFFQELAARVEGKAPFSSGQQRKEQLRAVAQTAERSRDRW